MLKIKTEKSLLPIYIIIKLDILLSYSFFFVKINLAKMD